MSLEQVFDEITGSGMMLQLSIRKINSAKGAVGLFANNTLSV
jgi:hypothetical protein